MRYPDVQMYPTVAGAVVPIVHFGANGREEVVLSPRILAKIYRGFIRRWDAEDIIKLNPSLNIPPGENIRVIARSDKSGTTETWKRSLAVMDADFLSAVGNSPSSQVAKLEGGILSQGWPSSEELWGGFDYKELNSGVVAAVAGTPYSIGYCSLDAIDAAQKYVVSPLDKGFDDGGVPTGAKLLPSAASVQVSVWS
jgi:ABC-type phosphate transport system substrate-binding protein